MRVWRAWLGVVVCAGSVLLACADSTGEALLEEAPAPEASAPASVEASAPDAPLEVAPALVLNDERRVRPTPPPPPPPPTKPDAIFQPGFHQALRWSHSVGSTVTFRMRVPVAREGGRIRVTFRSGDGNLTVQRATVAKAGTDGALASMPVPLTFGGKDGFSTGARTLVTSDPVDFPVSFRDDLAISFEARGALAVSAIDAFPGSYARTGTHSAVPEVLGGQPFERAVGVATVDVEGFPTRAFVALGDSITEGYIDMKNDTRNAWPALVEAQLGVPVVNAGVSGQGFFDALELLDGEVLTLRGITDCLVLLGTNDLGNDGALGQIQSRMLRLVERLRPFCRVWVSTLLPKEKSNHSPYTVVKQQRLAFNEWLRQGATGTDLIDLEAVTRRPDNPHLFLEGLVVDGIHPSAEGHRVMSTEVVRMLRERGEL
ncbi:SGNH/GDSL hydrolase family protein [Pyxidicoccus fallax]|uniref:SGNH/GDSL hydrolase family protein n=1 Tax=Pyxidicoccus fallax TaxID=394095 RepID=A0A848L8C2_9BACT|nr:SGNH/GDSL hydrolase family protein [Pyxidicoccus fallax]NMO15049.1 SGNH/GDSL hydrolase family protein [Pyxidicoccus fallax]NPC78071.1 SGNH/GDSL hydrolase family protein [Pyxidicoccus fallax]